MDDLLPRICRHFVLCRFTDRRFRRFSAVRGLGGSGLLTERKAAVEISGRWTGLRAPPRLPACHPVAS